jgi:hypothetical protein
MSSVAKLIAEGLNWDDIGRMDASELRGLLLMLHLEAKAEVLKKRRSAQLGAIKRKYKYRK